MNRLILIAAAVVCLSAGYGQSGHLTPRHLKKLAGIMAGDFNSNAQADADKSYYHILLRMKPIWHDRTDGYWFYVEQAVESSAHLPYRQRVYHLYLHDDTTIVSKVYEISNPKNYIGAWNDEGLLAPLSQDSLIDRQGCAIYLHMTGKGHFSGSTPGRECLSKLNGAAYATSEVVIYPDRIISWDRGWNDDGQQVWGAEEGGYVFVKQGKLK